MLQSTATTPPRSVPLFAQSKQLKKFPPFLVIREKVEVSTMIVFVFLLRNVDLYVYFFLLCGLNSTWYVWLCVFAPRAFIQNRDWPLLTLIIQLSRWSERKVNLDKICFSPMTCDFFHLFGQRRAIGVRVRDCETELYFVCKCAISQNGEILNLNNIPWSRSTCIMFNFLLFWSTEDKKSWGVSFQNIVVFDNVNAWR